MVILIGLAVVGFAIVMMTFASASGRSISMPEVTCLEFTSWEEADSVFQTLETIISRKTRSRYER